MKIKNDKGITLVALILTIGLLLILVTASVTTGSIQLDNMRLKEFYTKLEVVQENVEKLSRTNATYKNELGEEKGLEEMGEDLTESQERFLAGLGYDFLKFRFFSSQNLKDELDISGVDLNLLISFEDCLVISESGLKIKDQIFYTLDTDKYTVKANVESGNQN